MDIFGFTINRKQQPVPSPIPKEIDDGSVVVSAGGVYGTYVDLDGTVRSDTELINKYREVAQVPEVEAAIDEIANEAIINDPHERAVKLNLTNLNVDPKIKQLIEQEFEYILNLMNFDTYAWEMFRKWYVDGRLYYQLLTGPNKTQGINEIRFIDPRKIRRVTEVTNKKLPNTQAMEQQLQSEYYLYSEKGFLKSAIASQATTANESKAVKISSDSIVTISSGLSTTDGKTVMSYLHKAIKPVNQLRSLEDSMVIYRISRAPERRVFYIDVGNLPKMKAEQYLKDIMTKFKNKVVYDATSGEVRDDRKFMTMLEDFWLPRREGGRGTEITTLPGGCLAMDTKVSLLDGRELSISEIEAEMSGGKELWTYSCHPETGKVVPGLISWAGVTQESAEVLRLTLDNGETITCTPDHKFPVHGKGFVRADELIVGESMMALRRRRSPINSNSSLEYEECFDNDTKQWKFTHRMVADYLRDVKVRHETFSSDIDEISYDVRHHKDFNRFNNDPNNLCFMNWFDHQDLHADNGFSKIHQKMGSEAARKKLLEMKKHDPVGYDKWCQERAAAFEQWRNTRSKEEWEDHKSKISSGIRQYLSDAPEEELNRRWEICVNNLKKATQKNLQLRNDPEWVQRHSEAISNAWTEEMRAARSEQTRQLSSERWANRGEELRKKHKDNQKIEFSHNILNFIIDKVKGNTTHQVTLDDVVEALNNSSEMISELETLNTSKNVPNWTPDSGFTANMVRKLPVDFGYQTWRQFRKECGNQNHRIVAIEYLDNEIPVGTLTIDNDEIYHDYHTFALSVGIFTKNSNLGEIDDIMYFRKKLFSALNVPLTRLEPSEGSYTLGRATEITRDEVKFTKFINRLRARFSQVFLKILEKQLILKKIIAPEEWQYLSNYIKFSYGHDNYYAELKNAEILRERIVLLNEVDPYVGKYFSMMWIKKNILRQTEEDMQEISAEVKEELPLLQQLVQAHTAEPPSE